eukprot:COSAG04_NODE_385_length_15323_cov_3.045586_14_plen_116_part_00
MLFGAMVLFPAFGMLAGKHSSVSRTILAGVWAASSEGLRGGVGAQATVMQCACAAGAVLAVPAFWIIIKDDDLDLLIGEGLLVLCVIAYGAGLPSCERAHPRLATFIHETFIQTC